METVKYEWLSGVGDRWSRKNFEGSATALCDTIMVGPSPCTFVQTHRTYTTKSEPSCKWPFLFVFLSKCADPSFSDRSLAAEI